MLRPKRSWADNFRVIEDEIRADFWADLITRRSERWNTQLFGYPGGCAFEDGPVNKIIALGNHSSSAGALVLGLGCEGTNAHKVAEKIAATGRPVETVVIQETGGDILTIEKGSRALVHLIQQASMVERVDMTGLQPANRNRR